jgi:hypothetical protein
MFKSALRIIGYVSVIAFPHVLWYGMGILILAEILGIVEELVDKRKEQ